ncbi:MAG: amidohydrolase family protein [Flavobacteriaceae bacterium]|nr:amidohydrolase family protein [Flavobacteriaceae bacterium]
MQKILIISCLLLASCANRDTNSTNQQESNKVLHDKHVHIMSPQLISLWKSMGIPFSKEDFYYSDIDTIFNANKAQSVSLISMSYVYSSEEFGGNSENIEENVRYENDYLALAKLKHLKKIKAFYGIDPLQEFTFKEIERCHNELNLDGIKLHHNASQVYLTEPEHLEKIKSIFEYASYNQIPILMHFDNSHPKFGKTDVKILADSVITGLEYVNLQIAHFGTSGGFNQKTKDVIDAFIELFQSNHPISKHKITFDISAVCLDKDAEGVSKLTTKEFDELSTYCRKLGFDRIVFGTDYPLYRGDEYLNLLISKLRLTEDEIISLMKEKNAL